MLQNANIFSKLGLSEHEVQIYMLGLKLGPSPASGLAKRSGLGRTLVYHLLTQLKSKGLVSEQDTGRNKKFFMEPPGKLLDIVERKQKELEGLAIQIIQASKDLNSLTLDSSVLPQVRVYEGKEGLKNVAQEILSLANRPIKAILSVDNLLEMFDKLFLRYAFLERERKKITSKIIFTGNVDQIVNKEKVGELLAIPYARSFLHQWKKAPRELPLPNIIIIYGSRVAIGTSSQKSSVFVIDSVEFAKTMDIMFNDIWKRSTNLKSK